VQSNGDGLVTVAGRLGWTVSEVPRLGPGGLPCFKDMYFYATRTFPDCAFYGFVNGDILFTYDILTTLQTVYKV